MSDFPDKLDTPTTLFVVQDALSLPLAEDYRPGDRTVVVGGDATRFPEAGLITLTDQVSDPHLRAVTVTYTGRDGGTFRGVRVADDSLDAFKPRDLTQVGLQLRAEHHNKIKDAVIAVEAALGTAADAAGSLFGRINFLKRVAYAPKAWFTAARTKGLVPFTVDFQADCRGVEPAAGPVTYVWDFGDGTTQETADPWASKTYNTPGRYTVGLTLRNAVGEDTATIPDMVQARLPAPPEAAIRFVPQADQVLAGGRLRTPADQFVLIEAGAEADPKDPITSYTWSIPDDLPHANAPATRGLFPLGGLYAVTLRADTRLGAFRITTVPACVDVVERHNLWLWTAQNGAVRAHEYGLNTETFKVKAGGPHGLPADASFLDAVPNRARHLKEFFHTAGAAPTGGPSGLHGACRLFWAGGRTAAQPAADEQIVGRDYTPFTDVYEAAPPVPRPWNWAALAAPRQVYFLFGGLAGPTPAGLAPVNPILTTVAYAGGVTDTALRANNFINGAHDCLFAPAEFAAAGAPRDGYVTSYRTAWAGYTGYILRSTAPGPTAALQRFYGTEGTIGEPFANLVRLTDLPGPPRPDAELAALDGGVYVFANTPAVYVYREATAVWEAVATNAGAFRGLQDDRAAGHDDAGGGLRVAADHRKAFLAYEYSPDAFVKFSEADGTFSTGGPRPPGKPWQTCLF